MITLTTCFLKLIELKKQKKLVSQRMSANGHLFFLRRLGELDHYIDIYETEIWEHRKGWV
jgi:hypothetical protein